jgi:hypothetical protein
LQELNCCFLRYVYHCGGLHPLGECIDVDE